MRVVIPSQFKLYAIIHTCTQERDSVAPIASASMISTVTHNIPVMIKVLLTPIHQLAQITHVSDINFMMNVHGIISHHDDVNQSSYQLGQESCG
jgi:hypothetical protein